MNTFGVCRYDMSRDSDTVSELEQFNTYDEAYERYMQRIEKADPSHCFVFNDIWLVYIDESGRIVQFEQLIWNVKSKIISLKT